MFVSVRNVNVILWWGITGTLHEMPTPNLPSVEDGISEADMEIAIEEYRQKWGQNLQAPAVFSKPKLAEFAEAWGAIQTIFVLPILYLTTLCLKTLQCAAVKTERLRSRIL